MNRVRALLSSNPMVVDSAIALGLAALSMLAFVGGSDDVGGSGALTAVLLLLESVPLVWRRRFPVAVLLIVVGAMIVHLLIVPEGESLRGGLGVLVALFTIGERLERRISVALAVLTGAIVGVIFIAKEPIPSALQALIQTEVVFGVAWLVGDGARVRGLYTRAVEERASLLERERTASRQRDGDPGGRRPPRARGPTCRRPQGPRVDQRERSGGVDRYAPDAGHAGRPDR